VRPAIYPDPADLFSTAALDLNAQTARLQLQALCFNNARQKLTQENAPFLQTGKFENCGVIAQQILDLPLQHTRVVFENGDHFMLIAVKRADDLLVQQGNPFTQRSQRRFQFVRDMPQQARPIGLQLSQSLDQGPTEIGRRVIAHKAAPS
jgi:hypothetical protein